MNYDKTRILEFPVTDYIPEICSKLKADKSRVLILTAETGAGKSTVLPLGFLENFDGKILMTEPRRLAVLGVANRLSDLIDEECGNTVGYTIHLESRKSEKTKLEIMTEAVLIKILQENPELDGYNLVILDEAHERSINFDLALAFLKEAMELRDDLYAVVMSATIDCKKMAGFFNTENIMEIPGRTFPVEVVYKNGWTMEQAIETEIRNSSEGNILAFLPGISDIRKCQSNLVERNNLPENTELCILHSSITLEEQKKVLENTRKNMRRIILSSAIAETSLTVPGITTVIDSGFSRVSRIDIKTGMQNLITERESEFSAEQRKGRAGRIQKGKCIRLWSEHDVRIKNLAPEILRTDLAELVLECAERGVTSADKICWLDSPNTNEWLESVALLQQFEFLGFDNKITEKGKAALKLGLHPRLANIVLESILRRGKPSPDGSTRSAVTPSAGVPATPLSSSAKALLIKYGNYSKAQKKVQDQFLQDIERRISRIKFDRIFKDMDKNSENQEEFQQNSAKIHENSIKSNKNYKNFAESSFLVLAGFPDRIAHKTGLKDNLKAEYQFYNGRKAVLGSEENNEPEWIVAPEVLAGTTQARIFEFEEIPEEFFRNWAKNKLKKIEICEFSDKKIIKTENLCFGKIVISSRIIPSQASDYVNAWLHEIEIKGMECLPSDKKTEGFLKRAAFYFQQNEKGELEDYIKENAEQWLKPFISGNTLSPQTVYDALYWFLEGSVIDKEIPEILVLPNGNKAKVKYEVLASPEDKNILVLRPVIEIIIQRIFGCMKTPEICGMKALLRLLSPASRPLQITDDLENFWTTSWPEICKEMKGRYPKHNWDYFKVQKDE